VNRTAQFWFSVTWVLILVVLFLLITELRLSTPPPSVQVIHVEPPALHTSVGICFGCKDAVGHALEATITATPGTYGFECVDLYFGENGGVVVRPSANAYCLQKLKDRVAADDASLARP
jgi:hypothetical protein